MRVEDGDRTGVRMNATHMLASHRAFEEKFSFRTVLREIEAAPQAAPAEDDQAKEARVKKLLQELLAAMLEMLTGEKCRCTPDEIAGDGVPGAADGPRLRVRAFEWERTTVEHVEEHERTRFAASGEVRTADGRRIDFDLSRAMGGDFSCTRARCEQGKVEVCYPLLLIFDGKAAELSDARFSFDLDADGTKESLPMLAQGSGYLVLDQDHDGRIADGREVIGAQSGDAFGELGKLDSDGNGWIDEADPVYAALGVWFPDGRVESLSQAGVGALHTGSVSTPFSLRDDDNRALGEIRRSGVYLTEEGKAGTLQQIDLSVQQPAVAGDTRSA